MILANIIISILVNLLFVGPTSDLHHESGHMDEVDPLTLLMQERLSFPWVEFSTKKIRFMDEIISFIDKTRTYCPTDSLIRYEYNGNFYFDIYKLDVRTNTYIETPSTSKTLNIVSNGSYYIFVNFYDPRKVAPLGFTYKRLHFVTDQFLTDFYKAINYVNLQADSRNEFIDDDIDDCGEFIDWRFVVENGLLKIAVCCTNSYIYDLMSCRELSDEEFFKGLPIPFEAIADAEYPYRYFRLY